MSPVEQMQVEELLHQLTDQDDRFNAFVAELHFLLDAMECLSQEGGGLPDSSQFGLHLTAAQLKDRASALSQNNHYLHGLLRSMLRV